MGRSAYDRQSSLDPAKHVGCSPTRVPLNFSRAPLDFRAVSGCAGTLYCAHVMYKLSLVNHIYSTFHPAYSKAQLI